MNCRVQSCCCGCSLKTGSRAIGIYQIVCSMLLLIGLIGAAVLLPQAREARIKSETVSNLCNSTLDVQDDSFDTKTLVIILSVTTIPVALQLIYSIILVHGVNTDNMKLIKSWIIFTMLHMVSAGTLYVILSIIKFRNDQPVLGTTWLLSFVTGTAWGVYITIVVNSYYEQMIEEEMRRLYTRISP